VLTLVVDPTFDGIGSVSATVTVTPSLGQIDYGQRGRATFDRAGRSRRFALTTRDTAQTLVQVFAPALSTADGTTGTVSFQLSTATGTSTGSITGSQTVVTVPAGILAAGGDAVLTLTSGPGTTGSVAFSIQLDPGPATPLAAGVDPVALAPAATSSRYSFDATADQRFELYLHDVVYDQSLSSDPVQVSLEDPFGFRASLATLDPTFGSFVQDAFSTPVTGTWTLVLGRPDPTARQGLGVTATLQLLQPQTAQLSRTLPVDETVTFADPARAVEVTVPGHAGQTLVARVLDTAWTAPTTPALRRPPCPAWTPTTASSAPRDLMTWFSSDLSALTAT
jgi:hypothetical protein